LQKAAFEEPFAMGAGEIARTDGDDPLILQFFSAASDSANFSCGGAIFHGPWVLCCALIRVLRRAVYAIS
jgi:hypothetical protein